MPMHNGLLPREGFKMDAILRLIRATALNPKLLLPLVLLARFTKRGQDLAILHPLAHSRLRTLLTLGILRQLSNYLSDRVLNNWTSDTYNWRREVVVITGGAGGIGGHVARLLAESGTTVVVLDIQPLTYPAPSNIHYYPCDITSPKTLAATAAQIRAAVGAPTVLINNAGVVQGRPLLDASEASVRFTFDVNTLAHYWTVREFLPEMVRRNHGMVVTVASVAAWVTVPSMVDYAASKAASHAFHEGLAAELATTYGADRVRTVLVNQAYTTTPLFEGYQNDSPFLMPALAPETVAEAIVRQVLSGRSGQVVVPEMGNSLASLAAMPHWYQARLRTKNVTIMERFKGRQVVEDVDRFYEEKEKGEGKGGKGVEASGVLVGKD